MKTDTNTSTSSTFFWHDYETFGLSPAKDRPAQFAGVRTDMDLNEIGEPLMLYCQLPTDYLPSPESTLITGITPQLCNERGVPEPQFAQMIVRELAAPDTIGVGYNTIRFDDEVTRFMLWRNLFPPYKREFENGCSRWDLIDVVRCAYALRPEGIVWPTDAETGKTSLRLEHLTAANGLAHESAHDALSDVRATIAFARLLRNTQPRLFEFALKLRQKKAVQDEIGWPFDLKKSPKPFLHVSGMFGAERRYLAVVYPLAPHPTNKNELIVWDLAADPALLLGLSVAQIRERLFTSAAELGERGLTRLPIKTIHINKSPVVIAQLKTLNDTQSAACGVDWKRWSSTSRTRFGILPRCKKSTGRRCLSVSMTTRGAAPRKCCTAAVLYRTAIIALRSRRWMRSVSHETCSRMASSRISKTRVWSNCGGCTARGTSRTHSRRMSRRVGTTGARSA